MIMPKQNGLTIERLSELMTYDELSGRFTWIVWRNSRGGKIYPGTNAGNPTKRGCWEIGIDGKAFKRHHLAWFWMTGKWPNHEIDHKNGIPHDDVWVNLRAATSTQQKHNTKLRKNSRSGLKGVCWDAAKEKWMSRIAVNKRQMFLGYFNCPTAAHIKYANAAKKHFGDFARTA